MQDNFILWFSFSQFSFQGSLLNGWKLYEALVCLQLPLCAGKAERTDCSTVTGILFYMF